VEMWKIRAFYLFLQALLYTRFAEHGPGSLEVNLVGKEAQG